MTTEQQVMSAEALADIEARAQAATPELWHVGYPPKDDPDQSHIVFATAVPPKKRVQFTDVALRLGRADADFIAHARADIPALVAEVRRLTGEVEALQGQVGEWEVWYDKAEPTIMGFVFWALNVANEAAQAELIDPVIVQAQVDGLKAAFQRAAAPAKNVSGEEGEAE